MVAKASAYVGIISHRYGTIYRSVERNPFNHSICRLEFEEAQRLGLPTVIFEMSEDHPVKPSEIERDAERLEKLEAYRLLARQGRIYQSFDSVHDFTRKAIRVVANLRRYLEEHMPVEAAPTPAPMAKGENGNAAKMPVPPAFYAAPPYIGSHQFVGRRDQLDTLNEWALPADPHNVLLYEAIGGSGKSMLSWEWIRNHAPKVPQEWAGRFWYSFYERDGRIVDFCQHALAYMTGQPLAELKEQKTTQLMEPLLRELQSKPWLVVLDGLERALVAYHRIDAAQLLDEEAGQSDVMAKRDPCAAIRPEDDDLLRLLATAAPSKLLLTSRLVPRVLLNIANQPIPGVRREVLPGLRQPDAEAMFVAAGVHGDSAGIQAFLKAHCDCHPLTVGALAGLVVHYMKARGDFDAWSKAPDGAAALNLADLDLVKKRNHILKASIRALQEDSRRLLAMLALISTAIDYETMETLNPIGNESIGRTRATPGMTSPATSTPQARLSTAIRDLERRGLLQYDPHVRQYDLHPVVRAVAAGGLARDEKMMLGERVVDYFSARPRRPFDQVTSLDDLDGAVQLTRALVQIDKMTEATEVCDEIVGAMVYNLEAYAELLTLLRPFFAADWRRPNPKIGPAIRGPLVTAVGVALHGLDDLDGSVAAFEVALLNNLKHERWSSVALNMTSVAICYVYNKRFAAADRLLRLARDLATITDDRAKLFVARLFQFRMLSILGRWAEAEVSWGELDPMGRDWNQRVYLSGEAERELAVFLFYQDRLTETDLIRAERLAHTGQSRLVTRALHRLRGEWLVRQSRWAPAAASLHEAIAMAQSVGVRDVEAETLFAVARYHLGELAEPRRTAASLAEARKPYDLGLAGLCLVIGDHAAASRHALRAYKDAWADGEPYVHRFYLNQSRALLEELGAEIPSLPPYDPSTDPPLPWEKDVTALIDRLREEK